MINPMLQALNKVQIPKNLQNIKQMLNIIKGAKNPQSMIQSMIQQNPQMKQVMDYVNQNGGDPKKAFYSMAEQCGMDPDEILNMLK